MTRFLDDDAQRRCITVKEAVNVLEAGIRQLARGDGIRRPRFDNLIPTSRVGEFFSFSSMEGGVRHPGYYALRIRPEIITWPEVHGMRRRVTYTVEPGLYGGLVFLFSVENAALLSIMIDTYVQHLRVAATAAIGVKYLAKHDAKVLGMIGSGGMARSFAAAFTTVREIQRIQVYSPMRANAERYRREMSEELDREVVVAESAREALKDADIVATCTNSQEPVIQAEWLEPGTHIANVMTPEFGPDVYERVDVAGLVVRRRPLSPMGFDEDDFSIRDNVMSYAAGTPEERARIPNSTGHVEATQYRERYPNARYVDCVNWDTGQPYTRSNEGEITTLANASFGTKEGAVGASAGIQGIQYASIGGRIFESAQRLDLGRLIPRDMFLHGSDQRT